MVKKLNEILGEAKLRLLNLERLRQHVLEVLEAEEPDEESIDKLSAEVQRRLAQATDPEVRAELEALANLIYRHKRRRAVKDDDEGPMGRSPRIHKPRASCMCSVPDEPSTCTGGEH